jgi:hypothetical protein
MNEEEHQRGSPFALRELKPIQMPNVGHGGTVQGPVRVHRGAVDRYPPPVDRHDASQLAASRTGARRRWGLRFLSQVA